MRVQGQCRGQQHAEGDQVPVHHANGSVESDSIEMLAHEQRVRRDVTFGTRRPVDPLSLLGLLGGLPEELGKD
jgi:hypothetical protein